MQCDLSTCEALKAEAKDSRTGKLKIGVSLAKRSPKVGVYCRLCHPVCPKSLHSVRFRNVLNVISNEAYEFMRYAGGFDTMLSNWNAADALPWYLAYFGPEVNYMGLVDGYEAIPLKCDEFVKAIAQNLRCNSRPRSRVTYLLTNYE
ncbi:hypothetical protein [Scytonema sp. PCC 10023]|uniref:hypothetical protein n=1 Tax=Scytonema sp. PCC 10023 TaxID=1680591 RepID=UPI0039C5B4C5